MGTAKKAKQKRTRKTVKATRPRSTKGVKKIDLEELLEDMGGTRSLKRSGSHMDLIREGEKARVGRPSLFTTPEDLMTAAESYFTWCDENPWQRTDYKGSMVEEVLIPTARPYTLIGLCIYCGVSAEYFRIFKRERNKTIEEAKGKSTKESERAQEFLRVINTIEQTIYNQKFEGAAVGAFNANIISRDLGLVEKHDVTSGDEPLQAPKIEVYNSAPPLASAESDIDLKQTKKQ